MLFSSIEFIFFFLPLCVLAYFLCPRRQKNLILLVFSLIFYALGGIRQLPVLVAVWLVSYLLGRGVACKKERHRRAVFALAWVFYGGALAFFKYFAATLGDMIGYEIRMPAGISFYCFQGLSYVADVYCGRAEAERDPLDLGTYLTLFPQLVAGPIVKYGEISESLRHRRHTAGDIACGIRRFASGLAKKVVLADRAGRVWEELSACDDLLGSYGAIFFFGMQIYFDFSGYSDMAVGLGRIFGFRFPENFNYPYISTDISEFWRRWHITLSSWFREYVYIPLGGNRCGRWRTYANLLIVWCLTGAWHGSQINFLLWGVYFALILILEKAFLKRAIDRLPKPLRHLYATVLIMLGWAIFSAEQGAARFLRLLGVGINGFSSAVSSFRVREQLLFSLILIVAATPLPHRIYSAVLSRGGRSGRWLLLFVMPLAALTVSVAYILSSDYSPFLYFRF